MLALTHSTVVAALVVLALVSQVPSAHGMQSTKKNGKICCVPARPAVPACPKCVPAVKRAVPACPSCGGGNPFSTAYSPSVAKNKQPATTRKLADPTKVPTDTQVDDTTITDATTDAITTATDATAPATDATAEATTDITTIKDATAPATDTTAPATDATAPVGATASVKDTTAPATDTTAPVKDATVAATDATAPATDATAPVGATASVKDTTAPATTPVTDITEPPKDDTAPPTDDTAPAINVTDPETDATAPATDVKAPVTDIDAPQTDGKAPPTDTKAPSIDTKVAPTVVIDPENATPPLKDLETVASTAPNDGATIGAPASASAPVFKGAPFAAFVRPDAIVGTKVFTAVAEGLDVTFSIADASTRRRDATLFTIDPTTGEITTTGAMPQKENTDLSLTISATSDGQTSTASLTLTVSSRASAAAAAAVTDAPDGAAGAAASLSATVGGAVVGAVLLVLLVLIVVVVRRRRSHGRDKEDAMSQTMEFENAIYGTAPASRSGPEEEALYADVDAPDQHNYLCPQPLARPVLSDDTQMEQEEPMYDFGDAAAVAQDPLYDFGDVARDAAQAPEEEPLYDAATADASTGYLFVSSKVETASKSLSAHREEEEKKQAQIRLAMENHANLKGRGRYELVKPLRDVNDATYNVVDYDSTTAINPVGADYRDTTAFGFSSRSPTYTDIDS